MPLNLAFRQADEILANAIKCMTEITSHGGLVNIDFADMRSIMSSGGVAMIGMGEGQGANRASDAVTLAVYYNIPIMVRKNMLQDPMEKSTESYKAN